jgi:hypothetical protein
MKCHYKRSYRGTEFNVAAQRFAEIKKLIDRESDEDLEFWENDPAGIVEIVQCIRRRDEAKPFVIMKGGANEEHCVRQVRALFRHRLAVEFLEECVEQAFEVETPRIRRSQDAGQLFGLTERMRAETGIRTIESVDLPKPERKRLRKLRRRERDRLRKASRRRKTGKPTREQYLTTARSTQPWKLEGMSRATWFRKKKQDVRLGCSAPVALGVSAPKKLRKVRPGKVRLGSSANKTLKSCGTTQSHGASLDAAGVGEESDDGEAEHAAQALA